MSLPEDYLSYPNRKHGQDIDRYDWRAVGDRQKKSLPGGACVGVSIVVPLEFFMLNPSGKPFKHPGAMQTPYPDLRHYTTRDYGNRVGAFRLLKAFREVKVKTTFAVNAALLDRARPLIEAIAQDGHEIAAHGWDTNSIHWSGITPDQERNLVEKTRHAFEQAGLTPRSWLSPARQQSAATPDLIREFGFDICLDWEADTQPLDMRTAHGDLTLFPLLNELGDRFILSTKTHDEAQWRAQILEAAAMMKTEGARYGAQVFGFTMTPYIAGQPFRMWAVREILSTLGADNDVNLSPVRDLTDALT
ncbi:MAG: polysaccharide deacetylase family protein [Pseudomonadota bacterium]